MRSKLPKGGHTHLIADAITAVAVIWSTCKAVICGPHRYVSGAELGLCWESGHSASANTE